MTRDGGSESLDKVWVAGKGKQQDLRELDVLPATALRGVDLSSRFVTLSLFLTDETLGVTQHDL